VIARGPGPSILRARLAGGDALRSAPFADCLAIPQAGCIDQTGERSAIACRRPHSRRIRRPRCSDHVKSKEYHESHRVLDWRRSQPPPGCIIQECNELVASVPKENVSETKPSCRVVRDVS
jgi:hypothetical protein